MGVSYVIGPGRLQLEVDITRAEAPSLGDQEAANKMNDPSIGYVTGNYLGLEGALGYVFSF